MTPNMDRFIEKTSQSLHWIGVYVGCPVLVVVLFASLPQVTQNRGHIQMDMLYRVMPRFFRQLCDALTGLCGLIFSGLLFYQSFKSTVEMYRWNERAEMIAIPYWPFALFAGLCGLILCLQFSIQTVTAFRSPRPKGQD